MEKLKLQNKRTLIVLISILLILVIYYFFSKVDTNLIESNLDIQGKRVLLDSLKLDDYQTLYWFSYDDILGKSSYSYVSITDKVCKISKENAILGGDMICRIDTCRNDTIIIKSIIGFEIFSNKTKYKFINQKRGQNEILKPNRLKRIIPLEDICK